MPIVTYSKFILIFFILICFGFSSVKWKWELSLNLRVAKKVSTQLCWGFYFGTPLPFKRKTGNTFFGARTSSEIERKGTPVQSKLQIQFECATMCCQWQPKRLGDICHRRIVWLTNQIKGISDHLHLQDQSFYVPAIQVAVDGTSRIITCSNLNLGLQNCRRFFFSRFGISGVCTLSPSIDKVTL